MMEAGASSISAGAVEILRDVCYSKEFRKNVERIGKKY